MIYSYVGYIYIVCDGSVCVCVNAVDCVASGDPDDDDAPAAR